MLAVAIVGEGTRLAHQPVDDVAVIDAVVGATTQTRELIDLLPAIPDLNVARSNTRASTISPIRRLFTE